MSLVRVLEGDKWLSELEHHGPNKILTPVTLTFSHSSHQTRPAGSDLVPDLQGEP